MLVNYSILNQHQQNQLHSVLLCMIRKIFLTLSQQEIKLMVLLITLIVHIFLLDIQMIYLKHLIIKMICRLNIHLELYSMLSWERNYLIGNLQWCWLERLLRIINYLILHSPQHILFVRNMDILKVKNGHVLIVVNQQKFILVLLDIIVLFKTLMTVRLMNSEIEKNISSILILLILLLRVNVNLVKQILQNFQLLILKKNQVLVMR